MCLHKSLIFRNSGSLVKCQNAVSQLDCRILKSTITLKKLMNQFDFWIKLMSKLLSWHADKEWRNVKVGL